MSKRVVVSCIAALLVVTAFFAIARGQGRSTMPMRPAIVEAQGRFAMTTAYENFLWVLDTQSGDVKGYRFVQLKDEKGDVIGFRVQSILNVPDPR